MTENNPVVAYRHRFGKRMIGKDKEIVCCACHVEDDRAIVLRSENGERVKYGLIRCAICGQRIKVTR